MRRSVGFVCFLWVVGMSFGYPGTYPGFSFLTSETSYAPPPSYYVVAKKPSVASSYTPYGHGLASSGPITVSGPVYKSLRSAPEYGPTVYINKSPLYYPESTVFSDPLPIVPLPQLPAEFLTLKSGPYGGSESEVPKKAKKGRRGKSMPAPAPQDDDAGETEPDQGGYDSPRQTEQGGYDSPQQTEQGGYQGPQQTEQGGYESPRQRPSARQRPQSSGASGGYPSSFDANDSDSPRQREEAQDNNSESEATGGYPSSFNLNNDEMDTPRNLRNRLRSNRPSQMNTEEDEDQGDENDDEPEMMMISDDGDDQQQDGFPPSQGSAEIDDAEDEGSALENPEEEPMTRNRGKSGKKSKKGKNDARALNEEISNNGQKIPTFFVPTFGNNVLNTVYPAFSQNAFLRSLNMQNYPDSGQDISSISLTNEGSGKSKKNKKVKNSAPRRKNRPGRRGQGRPSTRQSAARAQEPNMQYGSPQQNVGFSSGNNQQYGAPAQGSGSNSNNQQYGAPAQSSGSNNGFNSNNQQYGAPAQGSGSNNQQYGAPAQSSGSNNQNNQQYGAPAQDAGINPPPQNNGGYNTIGNEMRQGTSNPPQFRENSQQYGAPIQAQTTSSGRFIEPRQPSHGAVIGNQVITNGNGEVSAELIRTVQAILEKYPN